VHSQSTPVKTDSSTTLPFTTNEKYRYKTCNAMADEMPKYIVGPMPPQQFLDEFFPINKLPDLDNVPGFSPGCYKRVSEFEYEIEAYLPFVSLTVNLLIRLHNSQALLQDQSEYSVHSKPPICRFT
jgi:hypothetical protein